MSEPNENKIFKEDKKSIMHYIKVMKDIKAEQDRKKEIETKAKKERIKQEKKEYEPYRVRDKYNSLSEEEKKKLYDSWLKYFPLEQNMYEEFLKPITYPEESNYLHSKIDNEYYELFEVFGNRYKFNKIFYDDPTSKKRITYPYRPGRIMTTRELKRLTLKKIFQMYIDVAIDRFRLEQNKETDLYMRNKIKDEKERIIKYYNRNSNNYQMYIDVTIDKFQLEQNRGTDQIGRAHV